jgi:streptogramin lyase
MLLALACACALLNAPTAGASLSDEIARYDVNAQQDEVPGGLVNGPDGKVWFSAAIFSSHFSYSGVVGNVSAADGLHVLTAPDEGGVGISDPLPTTDGHVWFITNTGLDVTTLRRVTTDGVLDAFNIGDSSGTYVRSISRGANAGVTSWVRGDGNPGPRRLLRQIDANGVASEQEIGMTAGRSLQSIALQPDGRYRLIETWPGDAPARTRVAIASMPANDPSDVTEHDLRDGINSLGATVNGPNSTIWMAIGFSGHPSHPSSIARLDADGTIDEFTQQLTPERDVDQLRVSPDGSIWFTEQDRFHSAIAKIDPSGTVTEYPQLPGMGRITQTPIFDADGAQWFPVSECSDSRCDAPAIGRFSADGKLSIYDTALPADHAISSCLLGTDGRFWFVERWHTPNYGRRFGTIDALDLTNLPEVPAVTQLPIEHQLQLVSVATESEPSLNELVAPIIEESFSKLSTRRVRGGGTLVASLQHATTGSRIRITWTSRKHRSVRNSTVEADGQARFRVPKQGGRYSVAISIGGAEIARGTVRVIP